MAAREPARLRGSRRGETGFAAAQTRGTFDRDIPVFYCVHIEEISGHRAAPDPVEASFKHS